LVADMRGLIFFLALCGAVYLFALSPISNLKKGDCAMIQTPGVQVGNYIITANYYVGIKVVPHPMNLGFLGLGMSIENMIKNSPETFFPIWAITSVTKRDDLKTWVK
jgi:hypothetical protein